MFNTNSRLDDDEGTRIEIPHPQNPEKHMTVNVVNEPGLYTLVIGSRVKKYLGDLHFIDTSVDGAELPVPLCPVLGHRGTVTGNSSAQENEMRRGLQITAP